MRLSILALVFIVTVINYLDRGALSFAILAVQKDLGINDVQFGFAAGAFAIGYTAMIGYAGYLVDRFGSIKLWALSAVLWSLVTAAIGLSQNFATVVAFRIALGVVEAVHFPALLKTMSDWLEPKWIARGISLSLFGVPIASVIGAPFITLLIESVGWRIMFYILGTLGIIWAFFWLVYFTGKKNPHLNRGASLLRKPERLHWKLYFTNPALLASCFVYFIFGYILFFALFWMPGYLEKTYGVSLKNTGWLVMLPWLMSAVFVVIGGVLSDLLMKKTRSIRLSRVYPTAYALLLTSICFFLLSETTRLETAMILVSLGLGFTFAINAPIFAFNADLFPNHVGTAQGISIFCFSLAGIVSPFLTGWLVQTSGHFRSAIFLVSALSLAAALIAFVFQNPREQRTH